MRGACANECRKKRQYTHTQSTPHHTAVKCIFDFCSQLSGKMRLVKVYKELSRALATVAGPSLFFRYSSLQTALKGGVKKRRGKYKVTFWLFTLFDGVMTNPFTHSPAVPPLPSLFLSLLLLMPVSTTGSSLACSWKTMLWKSTLWMRFRERERECQEMEFFKGRKTVNTDDNMNMNRLWGLIFRIWISN